jgi:FAD:protein FMN transferase
MDMLLTPRPRGPVDATLSRRRLLAGLGAVGGLALSGYALAPPAPASAGGVRFGGATMGTTYTVKIARPTLAPAQIEAIHADVQTALDNIDHGMSLYRGESELRRFNARPAGLVSVSEDFFTVLREAEAVAAWSGGAFDPTVAPLVNAWGFGAGPRAAVVPSEGELATLRKTVGFSGLRLDPARRSATKAHDTLALDFGGIAKGYGVDAAARALMAHDVEHFMIEAGGEVRTQGLNQAGRPWSIGIEQPDAWPRRARLALPLSGRAMATSGDYRNTVDYGERSFTHEIDPRTGAPIARGLASVTVIADNAMRADALATALIVLGPAQGFARTEAAGVAALFIERDGAGNLADRPTSAFAALGARRVG